MELTHNYVWQASITDLCASQYPSISSPMQAAGDSSYTPGGPCSGPVLAWRQLSPHQELQRGLEVAFSPLTGSGQASVLEDRES